MKQHQNRKGFTMMEMLTVVAVIVILAAIAIPSVISIQKALAFRRVNDYAEEIFMAAQSNLVEMSSLGTLTTLQSAADQAPVPKEATDNANFPEADWSNEYRYTTGGEAFDLVLPRGTIDPDLRSKKILIEYNPYTGNVYSVFYSEGSDTLTYNNVVRERSERKKINLGYYNGSGLSGGTAIEGVEPPYIKLDNGQEAFVRIYVPIPESYMGRPSVFEGALSIVTTVTGEYSKGSFTVADYSVTRSADGKALVYSFLVDSLADEKSFASLDFNSKGDPNGGVATIRNESNFNVLPGENVTIEAKINFTAPTGENPIKYDPVSIGGVNPMFDSMQRSAGDDRVYELYISNGRHLQNLNALAPTIASKVKDVFFSNNVYWNETQAYYNDVYSANYTNSADEIPGRGLPYFVPITNEKLFGKASFATAANNLLDDSSESYATVNGGKKKVLYLTIDDSETPLAKNYYAGSTGSGDFAGLFSYVNTDVTDLFVVNPTISGSGSAAGALVGALGPKAFLFDCGTYIDIVDTYYNPADFSKYHVSGRGAVGALVGFANSTKVTASTELDMEHATFTQCFGAVPVTAALNNNGYRSGAGGMVGVAIRANALNCYASSQVNATGVTVSGNALTSVGAGGFVGTSHGTKFYNCFATGNAINIGVTKGLGGFVGVCVYSETTGGASQNTMFTNCYSAGEAKISTQEPEKKPNGKIVNGGNTGRFCGNGSMIGNTQGLGSYYKNATNYLYKDSYFLNLLPFETDIYDPCAEVCDYAALVNLPVYQVVLSERNHDTRYQGGFLYQWESATAATTHSYTSYGSVYPFSKLVQMDYYGDWIGFVPSAGILYWENYSANGEDKGYYFDHSTTANNKGGKAHSLAETEVYEDGYSIVVRKGADSAGHPMNNSTVIMGEGANQRVFNFKNGTAANSLNINRFFENKGNGNTVTINGIVYYHLDITNEALEVLKSTRADDEYYCKLSVDIAYKHTKKDPDQVVRFTVYFNPDFALTQINPIISVNTLIQDTTPPDGPPAVSSVRTARQLYELGQRELYWNGKTADGTALTFQQEIPLDANTFRWNEYTKTETETTYDKKGRPQTTTKTVPVYPAADAKTGAPAFMPIGTNETPFTNFYTGMNGRSVTAGNRYPEIRNIIRSVNEDGKYGLFGTVGENGVVSCLTLTETAAAVPATAVSGGLLAAENRGTIGNIDAKFNNITMNSSLALDFGTIVGVNNGTLSDTLLSGSNVTLAAGSAAGGIVGVNSGTLRAASVNVTSTLKFTSGTYAGGVVGQANGGTYDGTNCTVAVGNAIAEAAGTTLGGFAGKLKGTASNYTLAINNMTAQNIAAGFAGEVDAATISNVNVTVPANGTYSGNNGASAVIGNYNGLTASLVRADIAGRITSANGNAAGAYLTAGTTASSLGSSVVDLSGSITATNGTAAGLAVTVNGDASGNAVYFGGTSAAITGKNAAGFAGTVSGTTLTRNTVTGQGRISGADNAAGFANTVNGIVSTSGVSPVRSDSSPLGAAYLNKSSNLLQVASANGNAAGFANTVSANASVGSSYGLAKVTGKQPAGFVNTNNGTVNGVMANVVMEGGAGFVGTNAGTVRDSYVWYRGTTDENGPATSFVKTNSGNISGVYAGALTVRKPFAEVAGTTANCYNLGEDDGAAVNGAQDLSFEGMALLDKTALSESTEWVAKNTTTKFPYSEALLGQTYEYPMLRTVNQYGDWKAPASYGYGVVYYEGYADGTQGYHVVVLNDPDNNLQDLNTLSTNAGLQVTEYGYAVFAHTAGQITSVTRGGAAFSLAAATEMSVPPTGYDKYHFYIVSGNGSTAADGSIVVNAGGSRTTLNGLFADAINPAADAVLHVSAAQQLQNVGLAANRSFVLDHNIDYSGKATIPALSGSLNGNGRTVSGLSTALVGNLTGTVQNLTIQNPAVTGSGTVGIVANTVSGANGKILGVNINNAVLTVSGADAVAGVAAGTASNGAQVWNTNVNKATVNASAGCVLGGAVGKAVGADLNNVIVTGLQSSVILPADVDPYTPSSTVATYTLGGLVGQAEKNSGVFTTIRNCSVVSTSDAASELKVDVEGAGQPHANVQVGGLVGTSTATITGSTVKGVTITSVPAPAVAAKEDGTNAQFSPAIVEIGGLVGAARAESKISDCSVQGLDASSKALIQQTGATANTLATYKVGGFVGFNNRANGLAAAAFTNDYAVAAIDGFATASKGQFAGHVSNGVFTACEGWTGSALKFLGTIETTANSVDGLFQTEHTASPAASIRTAADWTAAAAGQDNAYTAVLTNCFYQTTDGLMEQTMGATLDYYSRESAQDTKKSYPLTTVVPAYGDAVVYTSAADVMAVVDDGWYIKVDDAFFLVSSAAIPEPAEGEEAGTDFTVTYTDGTSSTTTEAAASVELYKSVAVAPGNLVLKTSGGQFLAFEDGVLKAVTATVEEGKLVTINDRPEVLWNWNGANLGALFMTQDTITTSGTPSDVKLLPCGNGFIITNGSNTVTVDGEQIFTICSVGDFTETPVDVFVYTFVRSNNTLIGKPSNAITGYGQAKNLTGAEASN